MSSEDKRRYRVKRGFITGCNRRSEGARFVRTVNESFCSGSVCDNISCNTDSCLYKFC
jgi:hypothetical protein